jgi:hypothetical protein
MDKDFTKDLIKGKIAEIIFSQMFSEEGGHSLIPFGYENITPELAHCGKKSYIAEKVKDNIRTSPDFVLISKDKENIFLVEVKYRSRIDKKYIERIAKKQNERWNPSYIFLATPEGFYYDSCTSIINNHGEIARLVFVRKELQDKYLELLKLFEKE